MSGTVTRLGAVESTQQKAQYSLGNNERYPSGNAWRLPDKFGKSIVVGGVTC